MIRLPALLILLLANIFFVLSLASGQDKGFQPDRVFPVTALQEDLQYLRYKLETTHPDLYQYTSRKNFVIFMDSRVPPSSLNKGIPIIANFALRGSVAFLFFPAVRQ